MSKLQSRIQPSKSNGIRRAGAQILATKALDARHPVCRGDFAAVVFSGRIVELGELPGEPTAHALYKFALPHPHLDASKDFARSTGMPLPVWPEDRIEPTEGVCFVFGDDGHPAVERLRAAGAKPDRHYVVLGDSNCVQRPNDLGERLARFVCTIANDGRIALLGYGHQGSEIARILRDELGIDQTRITACESNADSRNQAIVDGLSLIDVDRVAIDAAAVIYSPLMRHE